MIFKHQGINITGTSKFRNMEESESKQSPTWVGRDEAVIVEVIFLVGMNLQIGKCSFIMKVKWQRSQNQVFAKQGMNPQGKDHKAMFPCNTKRSRGHPVEDFPDVGLFQHHTLSAALRKHWVCLLYPRNLGGLKQIVLFKTNQSNQPRQNEWLY